MKFIATLLLMLGLGVNAVSLFANYNYITLQTAHVSFLSSLILTAFALALGISQILVPFALPVLQRIKSYLIWLGFLAIWGCAVIYSMFSTTGMIDTVTASIRSNSATLVEIETSIKELESQIASNKAQLDPNTNPTYKDLTQKQKNRMTNDNSYLASQLTKAREDKKKEIANNKDASTSDNLFVVYADKYKAYGAGLFELISFLFVYGANTIFLSGARKTDKKTAKNSKKTDCTKAHDSARDQHEQGIVDNSACTISSARDETQNARDTQYKLSPSELAALLKSNGDESLSYRKITDKYGVRNTDTIRDAKAMLAPKQQETSNLIILPTTTTKRAN